MAEAAAVVMQWLRPQLEQERLEFEGLRMRAAEIRAVARHHSTSGCRMWLYGACSGCEAYRDYLDMVSGEMCEIQDRVRGCAALMACCGE